MTKAPLTKKARRNNTAIAGVLCCLTRSTWCSLVFRLPPHTSACQTPSQHACILLRSFGAVKVSVKEVHHSRQ